MNFSEFCIQEYDKFYDEQIEFYSQYNLDSYSHWFYDQESELLRIYNNDNDEIYFDYVPIGSYSLKSNTWLWSWANEHSIEKNKTKTLIIKELGEKNSYSQLSDGLFECDKEECWNFAAITKNYIQSLGVYCVNSNDLLSFKLVIKVHGNKNSKEVVKLKQRTVDCGIHGKRRPAFVCQHLNLTERKGFHESFDTFRGMDLDNDDDFGAWCNECELVRDKEGEWNDVSESYAEIQLVCEECYFELKDFNK
ncbi:DUF6882 domain-containing protein [Tenacibaculum sp. 190524A05c]|uniref:DUF6882 domain-containing protein n=1 Tax=Tenacibaculum platacis TaxID=3137852 RepID=UPI0031FA4AC4